MFDLIDTDGSGEIDMSELRAYLMRGGQKGGSGGNATAVQEAPLNGDGYAVAAEGAFVNGYDANMAKEMPLFLAVVKIFMRIAKV